MAKILYALSGEGMGHSTRSNAVIEELQKKHNIMIACGGRAYHHLAERFDNIIFIQSLHMGYKNNTVSSWKTFIKNLKSIPSHVQSIISMIKAIRKFKPDIIINDFEYITNYLSIFLGIPNIIVDNEQVIARSRIRFPKRLWMDFIKSWLVIKLIVPKADFSFISSFFYPKLNPGNVAYCQPIIRKEVRKIKPKKGRHIVVYQTSKTNKRLLRVLRRLNHEFIIYGFDIEKKDGNLEFRRFNEECFIKDMAKSRAVIINGGFCVMSEALYLRKPVLSFPIKKQFEQILNAIYLRRLGYGMNSNQATEKIITEFIDRIPKFEDKLRLYPQHSHKLFFMQLENKIDELAGKS